jgi:YHS domain-containing protein
MTLGPKLLTTIVAAASLFVGTSSAFAQPDADKKGDKPATAKAEKSDRVGDLYALDTCPISGKKLGTMGSPVVKTYDGREVRFCCDACPPKFEKDQAASMAKVDEKITKDQSPLYPLKTSVVTGKALPDKSYEFVYGNRLIRLGAESEKADFLKDPKKYMADLDKAVIASQGKEYPLKTCMVSKEELGGDMGAPVDKVVAGRLIRMCCKDCKKDVEEDPAKFVAMVDDARKASKSGKPEKETKEPGGKGG